MPRKPKATTNVTQAQIARHLGLSRSIVTQALQGTRGSRVSLETRELVRAKAAQMGYRPRGVTTHAIGLLMPLAFLQNEVDLRFVVMIEALLREHGYRLTLVDTEAALSASGRRGRALAEMLNPKTIDGLLLSHWGSGRFRPLLSSGVPTVLVSEEDDTDIDIDQVFLDLRGTMLTTLNYLHGLGHRRVHLVMGTRETPFFRRLERAALEAASVIGPPGLTIGITASEPGPVAGEILKIMGNKRRPTALLLVEPELALLTYCGLLGAGYNIPRDISLATLFDVAIYNRFSPRLTSTTAAGVELARRAVTRLIEKIESPGTLPQRVPVAGDIIERESVRRLPMRKKG